MKIAPYRTYTSGNCRSDVVVANAAVQLIAPATNVQGMIVRHLSAYSDGGTAKCSFVAKSAPPVSVTDSLAIALGFISSTTGVLVVAPTDLFIPAGKGLYVICSSGINPLLTVCLVDVL